MSDPTRESAAALWAPLGKFIALERRIGDAMATTPARVAIYEFIRFGIKQAWACLFGGIMLALLIGTHLLWRWLWPDGIAPVARYDALFLAALAVQAALLILRLELWEEARVILLFHLVGTAMELFKTKVGSWVYPEPAFFRIGGVPLFTGFMYACVGSYIARAWRLFAFRFAHHPPLWALTAVSVAIYVNFFTHHYVWDARWLLFAAIVVLFARTRIYFVVWRTPRWMPLLLGFLLVALFIWLAENLATLSNTWLYPHQRDGWRMVGPSKLGAWYLLMIISYTLVAWVAGIREYRPRGSGR